MKPLPSVWYLIGESSRNMRFFHTTTAKYVLGECGMLPQK